MELKRNCILILKSFFSFSLIFLLFWGCVAGNPQLSVDRQDGTPAGTPQGTPAGTPGALPLLTPPFQAGGVGRILSRSEHFTSVAGLGFVYGKPSSGNIYRMVAPEFSLAQKQIKTQ